MKQLTVIALSFLLACSLVGNIFQHYRYSTSRPIMLIAGEPITRKDYEDQLDYQFGKQVLNKLAIRKMIALAAKKANVVPTAKDVDDRITAIDRRNPSLLEAAKQDPIKMAEMRQDLMTDVGFENLRIKDVNLTDAEVAAFYEKNKAVFALPAQAQTTLVAAANGVDAETAKTLLAEGMKPEVIARQARLRVVGIGGFQLPAKMPPAFTAKLQQIIFRMKTGDVASVPVGNAFLIVRLNSENQPGVPPLEQIRPLVTRIARLSKAPSPDVVLARLYKDANVTFEVDKYAPFFSDFQQKVDNLDSMNASGPAGKLPSAAGQPK